MIHYDALLQNATDIITKCSSYFNTKYDGSLLQNASGFLLQNATILLQNATFIINCDSTVYFSLLYVPVFICIHFIRLIFIRSIFFSLVWWRPGVVVKWRRGAVVITTAQFHSTKPELRFCVGSNPARGVSKIRDGEDL